MTLLGNISSGLFDVLFLLHLPLLAAVTEPPDPWQHLGLGSSAAAPHPHQDIPSPPDGDGYSALGGLKLVLGLMAEQEGGSWGAGGSRERLAKGSRVPPALRVQPAAPVVNGNLPSVSMAAGKLMLTKLLERERRPWWLQA